MKKTALVLAICALTLLIVLPAISSVNNTTSNTVLMDRALRADGEPLPPPIPTPPASSLNTLVADGYPLPPPIPPSPNLNTLIADGYPLPPPIPPSPNLNTLIADGYPLPPPIPPSPSLNLAAGVYSA